MKKSTIPEINWESEEKKEHSTNTAQDFISLLDKYEETSPQPVQTPAVGNKIRRIIKITSDSDVLLDCNSKEVAYMAKKDICDSQGKLTHKEGEFVDAYVIGKKDAQITLSTSMSHRSVKENIIKTAYYNKIPIKAKVDSVEKGGCRISFMNKRGFCPLSNMSLSYLERPQLLVGKEFEFIIEDMKDSFNPLLTRNPCC